VIIFQSVFPSYRGGIARFSDNMFRQLRKHVSVTPYNYRALYPSLLFPGKTQYLEDGHLSEQVTAEALVHAFNPFTWKAAARHMIQADTAAYVYSHWHPFFAASQIRIIKELRKLNPHIEIAGMVHNVLPHEHFPLQAGLNRRLFQLTNHNIVLSRHSDDQFRKLMFGQKPVRLFHPVYEEPWPQTPREQVRRRLGYKPDEIIVLFYGLVRPYKGLDVLIDALNLINLEQTRIRPLIVGEFYVDADTILSRIRKDHLPYYEILNHYVSDEIAADYLYASDVMVLPYRSASQSGIFSNALNFELPMVVSDLPGLTEHIEHGKNGRIFPVGDPVSLAKELCFLTENGVLDGYRRQMTELRQHLSWNRFAVELLQVFRF
jgi:glycosyltransferase involved in cell wall biosynthesis